MATPENALKFTAEAREAAVRAMATTGSRVASADAAGVCLNTIEKYLRDTPEFAAAMRHAKGQYIASLEAEATRRAVEGVDEPRVGYQGSMYNVRKFSDTLLVHLLKKKAPEEHGDSIKIDQNTHVSGSLGIEGLSQESRKELEEILKRELDGEQ